VVFTATNALIVSISRSGTNVNLTWTGGAAPFVVQQSGTLPAVSWSGVTTTSMQNATLPMTNKAKFFRVQSQ
jgi:hypothetical protein